MTFRRLVSIALLVGGTGGAGCAALPDSASGPCLNSTRNGECGQLIQSDAGSDGAALDWDASGSADAGVATPLTRSALCGGACEPDEPLACVDDAGVDAGADDDAGDMGLESCRVVLGANQQTSTACGNAGQNTDGQSCNSGADCAPGFECVGTGTCRHYCCHDDACTTLTKDSGGYSTYFCDLATEHAASGAVVPVCSQVYKCTPFVTQCPTDQTCTIVEIDGGSDYVATCDASGEGQAGDQCETQHCAANYACIGNIGSRTCQQLCDSVHKCSGTAATCNMQSPALAQFNGTVGVCSQ